MAEQFNHKRGAPAGNKNAVKHGFYCKELNRADRAAFKIAANMEDIAQEIALLRFEIKKATSTGDVAKLVPLSKAAYALEKLIRTQQKVFGSRNDLVDALHKVIRDVYVPPLTSEDALTFLKWKFDNINVPQETINAIQKQITPENEADLTYIKKQTADSA